MSDADVRVRAAASAVMAARSALVGASAERRARWLARAFARLRDVHDPLGNRARSEVTASSDLSPEMVHWALESTLREFDEAALLAAHRSLTAPCTSAHRAAPGRLAAVVLAANIFSAAARSLAAPLLAGWPTLVKASSADGAFAGLLSQALLECDAELGAAQQVLSFEGDDSSAIAALLAQADALIVYGSDRTLHELRAQASGTTAFIGHGHGLGVAYIARHALVDPDEAAGVVSRLALDVAAYDQRGCLSPHCIVVEAGAAVSGRQLARRLAFEGLSPLAHALPRGTLDVGAGATQLQWRGVAAAKGTLFEGDGFAISFEGLGPFRVSPQYRNVQLLEVSGPAALFELLRPLGAHLKCLGVAGCDDLSAFARELPEGLSPRLCRVGEMQIPRGFATWDGRHVLDGLVRWIDVDA